jgi:hypothetical protein
LGHAISQVVRRIANGVQASISSFLTALEMGGLGDHPTAQDTDSHRIRSLFHSFSIIVVRWQNKDKDFTSLSVLSLRDKSHSPIEAPNN